MKDCIALKNKVQGLVRAKLLNFENLNRSNEFGDLSLNLSQHLDQNLEQMLKELQECVATVREEYNWKTLA